MSKILAKEYYTDIGYTVFEIKSDLWDLVCFGETEIILCSLRNSNDWEQKALEFVSPKKLRKERLVYLGNQKDFVPLNRIILPSTKRLY